MRLTYVAALPVILAMAACSPSHTKAVAADKVLVDIRDTNSIKGRYDPAGFSSQNVRKMAASICKGDKLGTYVETAVEGQIVFEVGCTNGNKYGETAGVFFQRTGPDAVRFAATHSVNDVLVQTRGDLSL